MKTKQIILDVGSLILEAELFDSLVARKFVKNLPYTINLEKWGNELYGAIGVNLGQENPIPDIPSGGLAYTNNGNYFCIFFGQKPAWSVEYIGQIMGDSWKHLLKLPSQNSVIIRSK